MMKENTLFLKIMSILMIFSGVFWAIAVLLRLFLNDLVILQGSPGIKIAGSAMLILAILELMCGVFGLKAVGGNSYIHACACMGTVSFSMYLVAVVFSFFMGIFPWQAVLAETLGFAVVVFYLIAVVLTECTGGKWFLNSKGKRRKGRQRNQDIRKQRKI
ncbi:MAG: hypothetical protein SOZ59_08880 [Candidatus Limivivens sp.]|nr:hypothetical protein [Candidatus Limivivens sp.]